MSWKASAWVSSVRGLQIGERLVLYLLADRYNDDFGYAFPKIKSIAEDCEMSERGVQKALEGLEAKKIVRREVRARTDGRSSTLYHLSIGVTGAPGAPVAVKPGAPQGRTGVHPTGARSDTPHTGKVTSIGTATRTAKELSPDASTASGSPRRAPGIRSGKPGSGSRSKATVYVSVDGGKALPLVPASKEPSPEEIEACRAKADAFKDVWNANRGKMHECKSLNAERRRKIRRRLADVPDLDRWAAAIRKAAASPFCVGENKMGWVGDIEWLLRPNTLLRIEEGNYGGQPRGGPRNLYRSPTAEQDFDDSDVKVATSAEE